MALRPGSGSAAGSGAERGVRAFRCPIAAGPRCRTQALRQERAKTWAVEQAVKLARGDKALQAGRATLEAVFAGYEKHRTPRKSTGEQKQDARRTKMWKAVLGAEIDPHNVSVADWERFIDVRSTGAIDPRGRSVAQDKRHAA